MSHAIEVKRKVLAFRKKGFSLQEIAKKFKIAKSTASIWSSPIILSAQAQKRLMKRRILGQYKTILLRRKRREKLKKQMDKNALKVIQTIPQSQNLRKLLCTLLWWCEGNKDRKIVRFTSSDTTLIKNFLFLLRSAFDINESKFRALIHLHEYHNDKNQRKFWSEITKIPLSQFYKSYQKSNTGKRSQKDYPGCIAITYYDAKIAKELEAIYNAFTKIN